MYKMSKDFLNAIFNTVNSRWEVKQVKNSSIKLLENCNLREDSAIYMHYNDKDYSIEPLVTNNSDSEVIDEVFYISVFDIDMWISLGYVIAN